jgi:ParB/RepB/Spo0J family partition protein
VFDSGKPDNGIDGGAVAGPNAALSAGRPRQLRLCRQVLRIILSEVYLTFAPKDRGGSGWAGLPGPPFPLSAIAGVQARLHMTDWQTGEIHFLAPAQLGQRYRRYRLPDPDAETAMAGSFQRYGQLTPVVVCRREETYEVLDGFKRLAAARALGLSTVSTRLLEADERVAKAAIHGLNQTGRRTQEWEEAWIVHALVREDGMTQVEVAELLSRHKSWVCRRLALVEKLGNEAREDLRLGLLSATAARSLVRLPAGNQPDMLATLHRDELTATELDGVVDLVLAAPGRSQEEYILAQPRQALQQSRHEEGWAWDPRLSLAGNRVARRLASVLEGLGRMEVWLQSQGRAGLTPCDRLVLTPVIARLARDAHTVATLAEDLIGELHTHDRAQAQ